MGKGRRRQTATTDTEGGKRNDVIKRTGVDGGATTETRVTKRVIVEERKDLNLHTDGYTYIYKKYMVTGSESDISGRRVTKKRAKNS